MPVIYANFPYHKFENSIPYTISPSIVEACMWLVNARMRTYNKALHAITIDLESGFKRF